MLRTFKRSAALLAILAAAGTASAADLQIYGRIDAGLIYHN